MLIAFINQKSKFILFAFFVSAFLIICKTFQDYGVTWDEQYHQIYGNIIIEWYLSFFKDTVAIHHYFLIFYGGFFDAVVQLLSYACPWDTIESRHFLGGVFGLWAIYMSFKIARHIAGDLAGFFSALFLILHPVFYGHMFNNPVDIPFAALLLTTIYFIVSSYDDLPRIPLKHLFKIGVALGLTLAIRIGGILIILPYIMACWLLWFGSQGSQNREMTVTRTQQILRNLIRNLAWIFAIAWPVMLLWWPWAQINPLIHTFNAIFQTAKWDFNPTDLSVFFEGKYYEILKVPKSYLLKLILVTSPEFFLVVLGLGGVLSALYLAKHPKPTAKAAKIIFLIFAFVYPVLGAIVFNAPQFDGYRHFLFLIPLLAILGGISFAAWIRSKVVGGIKILVIFAVISSLFLTALDMRRLHPYQTVYFNRLLAGGLARAAKNYETDYWGNSYREGILWVIKNYHPSMNRKIRVLNASWPFQTGYYLEKTPELQSRFEMVETNPDIFLSTTRRDCHKAFQGKILYKVERDNTPLLYVIEVPENTPATFISTC